MFIDLLMAPVGMVIRIQPVELIIYQCLSWDQCTHKRLIMFKISKPLNFIWLTNLTLVNHITVSLNHPKLGGDEFEAYRNLSILQSMSWWYYTPKRNGNIFPMIAMRKILWESVQLWNEHPWRPASRLIWSEPPGTQMKMNLPSEKDFGNDQFWVPCSYIR